MTSNMIGRVGLHLAIIVSWIFQQPTSAQGVLGSVAIGGTGTQPFGQWAFDPLLQRVYLAGGYGTSTVMAIDYSNPSAPVVVATIPGSGVTVNPATSRLYTSGGFAGTVRVIDGPTLGLITTVPIGFCGGSFDFDATTNRVYVTSQCGGGNDPLHAINATTHAVSGPYGSGGVVGRPKANPVTGNIYVCGGPCPYYGPALNLLGNLGGRCIYEVDTAANRLWLGTNGNWVIVDGSTHANLATIFAMEGTIGMNPALARAYVVNSSQPSPALYVIDTSTYAVLGSICLGAGVVPFGVACERTSGLVFAVGVSGGQRRLYVVNPPPLFGLSIQSPAPGAAVLSIANATPSSLVYTAISTLPVVPTGTGPFFGLGYDAFLNLLSAVPSGVPPFVAPTTALGSYSLNLPAGTLPIGLTVQSRAIDPAAPNSCGLALTPIVTITF